MGNTSSRSGAQMRPTKAPPRKTVSDQVGAELTPEEIQRSLVPKRGVAQASPAGVKMIEDILNGKEDP
jgi:hypothetical protein